MSNLTAFATALRTSLQEHHADVAQCLKDGTCPICGCDTPDGPCCASCTRDADAGDLTEADAETYRVAQEVYRTEHVREAV